MTEPRPVRDADARDRIVTDLDRNLLVEAGAGSGKTQKLAERMAAGIASGVYELERMAAVTFTRKAAAELRGRFQVALEAEVLHPADFLPDPPRVLAHRCSMGDQCNQFARAACVWAGTNPVVDPFRG